MRTAAAASGWRTGCEPHPPSPPPLRSLRKEMRLTSRMPSLTPSGWDDQRRWGYNCWRSVHLYSQPLCSSVHVRHCDKCRSTRAHSELVRGLHYISFHFITLDYIALHCITLHYITLHYITLHYITLHYITLHNITLHYIALHRITLHCIASHHITLHYHGILQLALYIVLINFISFCPFLQLTLGDKHILCMTRYDEGIHNIVVSVCVKKCYFVRGPVTFIVAVDSGEPKTSVQCLWRLWWQSRRGWWVPRGEWLWRSKEQCVAVVHVLRMFIAVSLKICYDVPARRQVRRLAGRSRLQGHWHVSHCTILPPTL